jgi:hypothetical protein
MSTQHKPSEKSAMRHVELTVIELERVIKVQNTVVETPFHIVRPIRRDDPLWRSINENHETKWRCDGLWERKDDGNGQYYLEQLDDQGNPTEKYEHVAKCPYGNAGDRFRTNFITFEIVNVTVTRLRSAISNPSCMDAATWGKKWKENPFVWRISIQIVREQESHYPFEV